MESQEQISQLIAHLQSQVLVQNPSETWWDRQSSTLCVRATFENGEKFVVNVTESESIAKIKTLWQENLKSVFAKTSEYRDLLSLQVGKRYTVIVDSEMGLGVVATNINLEAIKVGRYAQYDNCIELIYKRKGARQLRGMQFYGKKSFAIFEGWIAVNTNPFSPPKHDGIFVCQRSKYLSFDDRYLTDAIASAGVSPLYTKLFATIRHERSSL